MSGGSKSKTSSATTNNTTSNVTSYNGVDGQVIDGNNNRIDNSETNYDVDYEYESNYEYSQENNVDNSSRIDFEDNSDHSTNFEDNSDNRAYHETDNSQNFEFTDESDNRVFNEDNSDNSVNYDYDGDYVGGDSNTTVNYVDAGLVDFAKYQAGESMELNSKAIEGIVGLAESQSDHYASAFGAQVESLSGIKKESMETQSEDDNKVVMVALAMIAAVGAAFAISR